MMFAFVMQCTALRPCRCAGANANRTMRSALAGLVGLIESRARRLHHVDPRLPDGPVELDPRRLEHPARRCGQLGARSVAGNEGDAVGHGADSTGTPRAASPVDSFAE